MIKQHATTTLLPATTCTGRRLSEWPRLFSRGTSRTETCSDFLWMHTGTALALLPPEKRLSFQVYLDKILFTN